MAKRNRAVRREADRAHQKLSRDVDKVFVVSFLSNVVVAALIVFLGDKLGVGAQLSTGVDISTDVSVSVTATSCELP